MRRRPPLISNLSWILHREGHNAEAHALLRLRVSANKENFCCFL